MPQEVTFHDDLVVLQNYLKELVEQLKGYECF